MHRLESSQRACESGLFKKTCWGSTFGENSLRFPHGFITGHIWAVADHENGNLGTPRSLDNCMIFMTWSLFLLLWSFMIMHFFPYFNSLVALNIHLLPLFTYVCGRSYFSQQASLLSCLEAQGPAGGVLMHLSFTWRFLESRENCCFLLSFRHSVVSNSLRPHGCSLPGFSVHGIS